MKNFIKIVRFELAENERKVLREVQRRNNKRDYVKATVLLMLDLGETPSPIAVFLGLDDATVYRHLENYQENGLDKFLGNHDVGYWGKLSSFQIGARISRRIGQKESKSGENPDNYR